jgi:hypothetical protein
MHEVNSGCKRAVIYWDFLDSPVARDTALGQDAHQSRSLVRRAAVAFGGSLLEHVQLIVRFDEQHSGVAKRVDFHRLVRGRQREGRS